MPYTYSHKLEPLPHAFLSWLEQKEYEFTADGIPHEPLASLENTEEVDIYYYNRSDTELGLSEWSGIIALNDKGYVAKLGLKDRNFIVLEEAENVATDEELIKWLDRHAILTPESPIYWSNEVLLSVLEVWSEKNSGQHGMSASIEFPPEVPLWEDPDDPCTLFRQAVYLTIHKQTPVNLWITQMAGGRYVVCDEDSKQVVQKKDYDAVEEYLNSLL